ncbi:hypothetical protein H5410_048769 [Solanum commersonii]|uniref:Uncharacterized protein n=1 Tax=Solanum commersonii TaxID=4109 RepID=A0A9J5XLG2_SOLCO|nr:hypothetical protein H5410_048769 [Solanum commersonii]
MFLNILAHNEKNRSVKVDYIRSGCSVIRAFNECLRAILKLTRVLLVKPNPVLEDDTDDRWKWVKYLELNIVKMLAKLYREKDERVLATFPKIMSSNIIRFLYYHCFEITH